MLPTEPLFRFKLHLPILWGDLDAIGHVNNLVYLRWFEEARIRYFLKTAVASRPDALAVILAHQSVDYLAPLGYPGDVEVRVSTVRFGRTSITVAFVVRGEQLGADVARGEGVLVAYDYATKQPVPLPDDVKARLAAYERGE